MARYKPLIEDSERHVEIDAFYVGDNKLIFTLLDDKLDIRRPRLDSSIVLIEHQDVTKHFNPLDFNKVTYRDVYYLPKTNQVAFIRKGVFRKSYKFYIPCSRLLGSKVDECTNVSYNWFYDSIQKRINFVFNV